MTTPYLPDDCIYSILKYLQPYRFTLFNCLLVNRFWCEAAVPFLYANPFDSTTNHSIILTLILCFDKSKILQLENQLKLINITDINLNDGRKPLFDYPKYLKNYDCLLVNSIIFKWLKLLYIDKNSFLHENFTLIFHQSILYDYDNIKQLKIPLRLFCNEIYKNCDIQTITSNLSKLDSLTLHLPATNSKVLQEFLSNMANVCLDLKRLELASSSVVSFQMKKVCKIIQEQNNLKIFKILYYNHLLNDLLLSLDFQKNSLIYVEFEDINFLSISFNNFINLHNLKYLKFHYCRQLSLDQCNILNFVSFKLKVLIFINNTWSDDVTSSMIKYLTAHTSLKELILIQPLKIQIIENISIYCPDLITLEIEINSRNMDLLVFSHFKNLKIRNLNITFSYLDLDMIVSSLANNLPISVKKVSIRYSIDFYYPLLYFKEFLENCCNCLEIINLNLYIELEFLEIILNYIEKSNNSNLKFIGINLKKVLNNEELNLLGKIDAKGVKIVDFNNDNIYENDELFNFV